METGKEIELERPPLHDVKGMVLSPDGRDLALWGHTMQHRVLLLPVGPGQKRGRGPGSRSVTAVDLSPNGDLLVCADGSYGFRALDVRTGEELHACRHAGMAKSLCFDPSGKWLAAADYGGNVTVYGLPGLGKLKVFPMEGQNNHPTGVAFSPDSGRLLVCGHTIGGPAYIIEYRTNDWSRAGSAIVNSREACSLAVPPDGTLAAVGTFEATVELWSVEKMEHVRSFPCAFRPEAPPNHYVWDVAFSPDGALLAAPTYDGLVHVWEVTSGRERCTLDVGRRAWDIEFSPDGRHLLVGGDTFSVWSLGTPGKPALSLPLRSDVRSVSPPRANAHGVCVVVGLENGLAYLVRLGLP